jgi:hypothetical protein
MAHPTWPTMIEFASPQAIRIFALSLLFFLPGCRSWVAEPGYKHPSVVAVSKIVQEAGSPTAVSFVVKGKAPQKETLERLRSAFPEVAFNTARKADLAVDCLSAQAGSLNWVGEFRVTSRQGSKRYKLHYGLRPTQRWELVRAQRRPE